MHGTWIVCVSAVVALVAASRASAMPPMPVGGVPTFVKDCKACSPEDFCEISYPGTPEGQVACVSYAQGNRHGLYRRYLGQACTGASYAGFVQCDAPIRARAATRATASLPPPGRRGLWASACPTITETRAASTRIS